MGCRANTGLPALGAGKPAVGSELVSTFVRVRLGLALVEIPVPVGLTIGALTELVLLAVFGLDELVSGVTEERATSAAWLL